MVSSERQAGRTFEARHRLLGPREQDGPRRGVIPTEQLPTLLPYVRPVHEIVTVDVFLPGCPPPADAIFATLLARDLRAAREGKRFASPAEAVKARVTATGIDARAAVMLTARSLRREQDGGWRWRTDGRLRYSSALKLAEDNVRAVLGALELPALLLYYPVYTYGVRDKIHDVQMGPLNTPGDRYRSLANWYSVTKRVTVASVEK